jgi:hypothetical protein
MIWPELQLLTWPVQQNSKKGNIKEYWTMGKKTDNQNNPTKPDNDGCPVCKDLLIHMQRFFEMLESTRRVSKSDWLTVEEIAKELRISKNVVYRLIRNGELGAINIVDTNGHIAQRGHYRVNRTDLQKYILSKKVKASSGRLPHSSRCRRFPKVRNHLGL